MLYQKHLSKAQYIYREHTNACVCTQLTLTAPLSNTQEEISSRLKQARVTTVTGILTTITLTSGVLHKHETKSSTNTTATTRETCWRGGGVGGQWNRARGQNNTLHSAATWTPTHERSLHMTRETESLDQVTPVQDWE